MTPPAEKNSKKKELGVCELRLEMRRRSETP